MYFLYDDCYSYRLTNSGELSIWYYLPDYTIRVIYDHERSSLCVGSGGIPSDLKNAITLFNLKGVPLLRNKGYNPKWIKSIVIV